MLAARLGDAGARRAVVASEVDLTIGVVIPAFNAEKTLAETLLSVQGQLGVPWVAVVVDDGSADGTAAIACDFAKRDPRISVVRQRNGGLSVARNEGLRILPLSASEVLFLDSDDVLEPHALLQLKRALDSCSPAVGTYGLPRDMTFEGQLLDVQKKDAWGSNRRSVSGWGTRALEVGEPTGFNSMVIWPAIETAGQALIRRNALEVVGPWKTMPGEDWEMWLRLTLLGEFSFLPEFVLRKRMTPNSLSSNGKWLAQAEPMIRDWLATDPQVATKRHVARSGEFYAALRKVGWALADFRKGRLLAATRQALRAGRSLAWFSLRWFVKFPKLHETATGIGRESGRR